MPHIRPFEIALIATFAIAGIGGLFFLSSYKADVDQEKMIYGDRVTVWGTFDQNIVKEAFSDYTRSDKAFEVVKYVEKDERNFEGELLNAIADGNPPDLVMLPHTLLATYRSKLFQIPETSLGAQYFKDTYIDGASIFRINNVSYAVPFAVDPLVMYWNRDLFANVGLAQPPKTWETLMNETTPALTRYDDRRAIYQSAIGLGEYSNITHAKEILSMLFLQSGTTITEDAGERYTITLANPSPRGGIPPAQAALSFYTQFANPSSLAYTWSRALGRDQEMFLGGSLAMYLGFGSELSALSLRNPNLSFDVSQVPQGQGATVLRNYGTFYGFAIPKASQNITGAFKVAFVLTGDTVNKAMTEKLGVVPVNRTLYTPGVGGIHGDVLRGSAIIARGWLDPLPNETEMLFKTMVEKMQLGRSDTSGIIADMAYSLFGLFK